MRRSLAVLPLLLSLLLAGCRREAEVRGAVALAEKVTLSGARLEVTLVRANADGSDPRVRAVSTVDSLGAPPWPFVLHVAGGAGDATARWELRAKLLRLGQAMVASDPVTGTGASIAAPDTLWLKPVRGHIVRGASAPPTDAALTAARAGRDERARVSDDAALGTTASHWQAWLAGRDVRLIEETMEPAEGGHSELSYVFAAGRLVAFEEHGERAALLPGRPSTLARIDVQIRWPEPGGEPEVSHRIEGLDAMPDHTLVLQVIARADRLRALAAAASAAH